MTQSINVNGTVLSYRDEGSGTPLVLVHGFCGSSEYWQHLVAPLSRQFRVITPNLRGHGSSTFSDAPCTMDHLADDIACLLAHLKLESVILLGHSLGGYVTLAFAERYPEKLSGFGLIHSTAFPDDETAKVNRNKGMESIRENGIEPFIKALVPKLFAPEHLQSMPEAVQLAKQIGRRTNPEAAIRILAGMRDRPDRLDVLRNTDRPVLLVAGEKDQIIPVHKAVALEAPHVTPVLIPGAGHMSMLEAPETLMAAIRQFADKWVDKI